MVDVTIGKIPRRQWNTGEPQQQPCWPGSVTIGHYDDVIMSTIASQITSLTIVYSTNYSGADQSKHQSSASLAFVWGIHRDRWIPRTKGQLRGKCFHLMTSSCSIYNVLQPWRRYLLSSAGLHIITVVTQRTHDATITSLLHQNDVISQCVVPILSMSFSEDFRSASGVTRKDRSKICQ